MDEKNIAQEEQKNTEPYRYTYRACTPDQKREAESILRQYEQPAEDSLSNFERVQNLQKRIDNSLTVFGLSLGIIGCLLFGGGLSAVLLKPDILPLLIVGLVLCAFGTVVMAITYPLYHAMKKRLQAKYKDEIVRLCKQVLDEE